MNRAAFGSWGAGLDPTRFAAALAALGVTRGATGSHALDAVDHAWSEPVMRWQLPATPYEAHDAAALAAVWRSNRDAWRETHRQPPPDDPRALATAPPRMAVNWPEHADPTWLVAQLSSRAIGPLSVHVVDEPRAGRVRWSWPLEIGLFDDPQSEPLRRRLGADAGFSPARFAKPRAVSGGGGSCDLLLVTEPLRAGAARVLASGVRASCVLFLRPPTDPWTVTGPLLRALRSHVGAAGLGFAPVPPARLADWLGALLVAFANDHPLDVALRLAGIRAEAAPPLLLADAALLDETRLSRVAERLEARAERGAAAHRGPLRDGAPQRAGAEIKFDSDLHGASDLLRLEGALRMAAAEPDPPRFIQARVLTAEEEPLAKALEPGVDHLIAVRVGPPELGWASAAGEAFPRLEGAEPYRLTVVLSAPDVLPEPAVEEIVLPPRGASTQCSFHVRPGPTCTRLRARIIVLHGNRVLQTATLDAPVGDGETGPLQLEAEREAVVRLRLDDLDSRRPFDAALLVNHDESGTPGVTAVAGGRARLLIPTDFRGAVDALRDLLEDAVLEPAGYGSLDDDSSVQLLRTLANHGSILHDAFMLSDGAQSVVDSERLQLVALRLGADFPLEFVYERVAPVPDAQLCPRASDSLQAGRCDAACPAADDPSVVCPLAFWGLTRSIERIPYKGQIEQHELEVLAEPSREIARMSPPSSALYAASSRVSDGDVDALGEALNAVMDGHARRATSWEQWRESVASEHPAVLVILPHTLPHPQFVLPAMEISDDAPLAHTNVSKDYVCPNRAHRPLVILLGCNTAATDVPIHDFPSKFRSGGAAIVLGTVTKVLGRHAAPVAGTIVASSGEAYITDVVRDVRRALLADGLAFGMTLVAYGDGEWILGGE